MAARFVHVNLIARNWKALAAFYETVFGCVPVPPERDLSGPWLDAAADLENAHIRGMHLRLPGYGPDGPTLEIFSYDHMPAWPATAANVPGFTHIAFAVDDVAAAAEAVMAHGGQALGVAAEREIPGAGRIVFQYLRDPEGNILELQRWEAAPAKA